jgi:hypothetical protein
MQPILIESVGPIGTQWVSRSVFNWAQIGSIFLILLSFFVLFCYAMLKHGLKASLISPGAIREIGYFFLYKSVPGILF